MAEDEMDSEEFLSKLDELKEKLPYKEYRQLESHLPYGLGRSRAEDPASKTQEAR